MYQQGDFVMKIHTGVCRVADLTQMASGRGGGRRLYYTLVPLSDDKSKIFVPAEPEPGSIRRVMTGQEAAALLKEISGIDPVRLDNEKLREQVYRELLKSNDPRKLAGIIKTIYLREQKRTEQEKKQTAMDRQYFQLAEELLYSELALVLGKAKGEIPGIIRDAIGAE